MTTLLSIFPQEWAEFRVAYRTGWNDGASWTLATMWDENALGLRVANISRVALPEIGEAVLEAPFGIYDENTVNVELGGDTGGDWEFGSGYSDFSDELLGTVVRIQARSGTAPGTSNQSKWTTVFLGVCLYRETIDPPASAPTAFGLVRWRCVDLLYHYASQWQLRTHGYSRTSGEVSVAEGHPGYNTDPTGAVLGNKSTTDTQTVAGESLPVFATPGSSYSGPWTDQEVIEDALCSQRASAVEPKFQLRWPTNAGGPSYTSTVPHLQDSRVYPVDIATNAWEIITKILRRQRGIGVCFLDWPADEDDPGSSPSSIDDLYITIHPQTLATINVGGTGIIGASSAGTTTTLDLIGDHRLVDKSFTVDNRDEVRVDYLETVGEPIEVAVTVGYPDGTLEEDWSNEADYNAADEYERGGYEFAQTYNRHRLATSDGTKYHRSGSGDGSGTLTSFAFYQDDDGVILQGTTETSSLAAVQIMPDLPYLSGWDYSLTTPAQADDSAGQTRRPPMVLIKTDTAEFVDAAPYVTMRIVGPIAVQITSAGDQDPNTGVSTRKIGDTSAGIGSDYDYYDLSLTLGIRLNARLRRATGDDTSSRRRTIYLPEHHLWLAADESVWDLGDSDSASGSRAARQISGIASDKYKILRDDGDALAIFHALAWAWYGATHRACTWSLRACGLLPDFPVALPGNIFAESPTKVAFPKLGYYVTQANYAGEEGQIIGTPITSIEYDNNTGITRWTTDWSDLDGA